MTGSPALNSGHLDDLTATRLCAEALDFGISPTKCTALPAPTGCGLWNPLHDDAQAMALVKRFGLQTSRHGDIWLAAFTFSEVSNFVGHHTEDADLNRAIVYCVAKMQSARIREGANPHSISEEK